MSSPETQGGAGRREVAYRVFAAEFDDADFQYSAGEEERAPNYVITPTGARINRLFVVGVLTEIEDVSDDVLRARVVDPTGAFVIYAGQYQPDAMTFLERASVPSFVAVTGKARTYQPDDSDRVFTSVRPESINEVDADTRDRWTVQAAEHTLDRVATFARALDRPERGDDLSEALLDEGIDYGLAAGIPLAIDHYGTTEAYLAAVRDMAIQAAEVVTGDREEVEPLGVEPDEGGEVDVDLVLTPTPTPTPTGRGTAEDAAEPTETGEPPEEATETVTAAAESEEVETREEPPAGATADPADDLGDFDDFGDDDGADEPPATDEMYELDDEEREQIEEEFGTEFNTGTEVDEPGEADIDTSAPGSGADEDEPEPAGAEAEVESGAVGVETEEPEPADASGTAEGPEGIEEPEPAEPGAGADDTGEPDDEAASEPVEEPEPTEEAGEAEVEESAEPVEPEGSEPADAEDVDLEDAVVGAMRDLDEGDGADRGAVIDAVVDRYGVAPDEVEDAIQDALMGGKCYEPDDDTLKAI